jgi:hypothetical protein
MLEFRYSHPRTGAEVEIRQAVRVPRGQAVDVTPGQRAEVVCWGVMPSGMLRHPLLIFAGRAVSSSSPRVSSSA